MSEKLGFEEVGEMISLSKGECSVEDEVAFGEEAKGVPVWPMVSQPEGKST